MEDLRPLSYGITTALFVIALITIPMRIWVRGFTMRSFGWDDWMMTSMLVFFPTQQGLLYFFLAHGAGMHIEVFMAEHAEWFPILLKGLLAEEFFYIWMQFALKMCFLLFFFRLSNTPWFIRTLWTVIVFHVLSTIAIWLLYGLQCIPLEAFYYPELHPTVTCLDTDITYFIPYSLNLFVDIAIFILPLPVILSLQMTLKRRLAVLAILTTGGAAVLCGGLRAIILFRFSSSPDFTYVLGEMVIISAIEMDMAVLCANMPALKAFWSCWRQNKLGAGQGRDMTGGSGTGSKVYHNHAVELNSNTTGSKNGVTVSLGHPERLQTTESEEDLWENTKGKPKQDNYKTSWRGEQSL